MPREKEHLAEKAEIRQVVKSAKTITKKMLNRIGIEFVRVANPTMFQHYSRFSMVL